MIVSRLLACASLVLLSAGCSEGGTDPAAPASAETRPAGGDWPFHGRTPDEQRYSPLDQINSETVAGLGLEWTFDTGENRKHESTPIVVDGVMYLTAAWSIVHALDAVSGQRLWSFDPEVHRGWARYACCGVVNRGVAVSKGAVFVGSLDGRLIKLDAETGAKLWEIDTTGSKVHYTITGAPRVVKGKVIIGNGGAEYGVRGYVSAYDEGSGELLWRFFTVPGDPSEPFEHPELEQAAGTWSGEWWKVGGGGTVWDSMAYDAELDLLYVGTGNGSPWSRTHRSPGGGDNLYLSSILALDPDDGRLVWYYQTTPGDNWDYTATQHIMLADLEIAGEQRAVLMQAPKNGFFYVLDRATGELLAAEKYAEATWATHVDRETGRPVESASSDYDEAPRIIRPSPGGAHNWEPMAFSQLTGLVYVPARDSASVYGLDAGFSYLVGDWNTGLRYQGADYLALRDRSPEQIQFLLAWDPRAAREVWRVPLPAGVSGGGVLATAGNLVFQGDHAGRLSAYAADDGRLLWQAETSVGIMAPPVTYEVEGIQYLALVAGVAAQPVEIADRETLGRVFAFRLGGKTAVPDVPRRQVAALNPPPEFGDAAQKATGEKLYGRHCGRCHGRGTRARPGAIPDLRYASREVHRTWPAIVVGGARASRGMPAFTDVLSLEDAESIRSFVVGQAHLAAAEAQSAED